MTIKGDANRYGALAATLHWASAIAVLMLLPIGFLAANASDPARTAALLRVHAPLGALVFALTLTRIAWRFFDKRPDGLPGQPNWQAVAARVTHTLLYVLLILMALSGIGLMVLSGAAPILFFGAPGGLPRFLDFPPMTIHALGAFAIIGLSCIHIGAALYHQFYRRDRPLARMGIGSSRHRSQ